MSKHSFSNVSVSTISSNLGLAEIGGGGVGILIAGFAQLIPESNPWRTVLVIIAPAISLGVRTFWNWAASEYSKHNKDKKAEKIIKRNRNYFNKRIADPMTTEDMRENYKKKLENLEDIVFNRDIEKIKL